MGNSVSKRRSNIELLRIIAMVMIIASHYVSFGVMKTGGDAYTDWAKGSALARLFTSFFAAGGDTGVGVFFIITGYFLSKSEKPRKLNGIVCPVIFYALLGAVINVIYSLLSGMGLSFMELIRAIVLPLSGSTWWFATAYVVLVLLSPRINGFIGGMEKKKLAAFIIAMWLIWYCGGYALQISLWSIERGVFYYFVGAYFKASDLGSKKTGKGLLLTCFALSWAMYWTLTYMIGSSVGGLNVPSLLQNVNVVNILKLARAAFFAPLCAVLLFLLFLSLDIKSSVPINKAASATFGIYLLHEFPANRDFIWYGIFGVDSVYAGSKLVVPHLLMSVICIFAVGMVCDMLRKRFLEKPMDKLYFAVFGKDN